MQRLYAHRALTYDVAVPPGLAVAVDSRDLDEMIANLLDNASKWARSSVRIEARHRIIGNAVEIAISDDGDGIAADALGRVFAPGERLDETMPGSGLGLAIVQDLAVLHDGTIALQRAQSGGLLAILRLRASYIS
jgi:signal transduction histidine kinase